MATRGDDQRGAARVRLCRGHRRILRVLSSSQGGGAQSDRRPSVRVMLRREVPARRSKAKSTRCAWEVGRRRWCHLLGDSTSVDTLKAFATWTSMHSGRLPGGVARVVCDPGRQWSATHEPVDDAQSTSLARPLPHGTAAQAGRDPTPCAGCKPRPAHVVLAERRCRRALGVQAWT